MRLIGEFDAPDTKLLPDESQDYAEKYNAAFQAWLKDFQASLARNTMSPEHAAVATPKTTIGLGSSVVVGGATVMVDSFDNMFFPNTYQTTTDAVETVLSYTGRGILQRLVGQSQNAAGTSTSAGFYMKITIDGAVIYDANPTTTNNRMAAVVGSLNRMESPTAPTVVYGSADDVPGLPFNSNILIQIANLTPGQPVRCGYRLLKKL